MQFVGIDMKPSQGMDSCFRQLGMDWEYIQHDLNDVPWPVSDGEFDLVMAKNIVLALHPHRYPNIANEYVRALKPGGTLEIWEHDTTICAVRPQSPDTAEAPGARSDLDMLGIYPVTSNCPVANKYIVQYNAWLTAGMSELERPVMPCAAVDAMFGGKMMDGTDNLCIVDSKRVAIPLAVNGFSWEQEADKGRVINADHMAIRWAALNNFIALVEALEPILEAKSGKNRTDWDAWLGKAKKDWVEGGGLASGECFQLGAWCFKKMAT